MNIVFKFGGSSLADAQKIKQVANFIVREKGDNNIFVVVSAMGKTTNKLVELAGELAQSVSPEQAHLISAGEYISAAALSLALSEIGKNNTVFTADNLIYARGDYNNAIITGVNTPRLKQAAQSGIVIVCGFQGVNERGERVLLGRGGSDTTAVALGAALNAPVKIFTDVSGFCTLDPNAFSAAKKLKTISANSALNLANAGAKVLDKRALMLANKYKVKVEVLKSMQKTGTKLSFNTSESAHVDGVSYLSNLYFIKSVGEAQQQASKPDFNTKLFKQIRDGRALKTYKVVSLQNDETPAPQYLPCELITIAGSGLDCFPQISNKLKEINKKLKTCLYLLDVCENSINMVVKAGEGLPIISELATSCKLLTRTHSKS